MKMSYSRHATYAVFLFWFSVLAPVNLVHATNDAHYEEILENTHFLNSGLRYDLKVNIMSNWNTTSQSEERTIKDILDSVDQFENIKGVHPAIDKSLRRLRVPSKHHIIQKGFQRC